MFGDNIFLNAAIVVVGLSAGLTLVLQIANKLFCDYGECEITINKEKKITVEGGCSLLDALYANQIFIPSACGGQGTCGFCKVRVLDGGGQTLPTEVDYLEPNELTNGTRLACQVKVKNDMELKVREDFLNVQEFTGVITKAEMKTEDTREIHIKLQEPTEMKYRPGQYIQINVPHPKERVSRAYSICSQSSRKNEVELLVRLIPGGLGSTYMHEVQVGDEISLTGPYGEFELDTEAELICIGGGCGMAPMRSILRWIAEENPEQKCWLFFGARTPKDAMYYDEFIELAKSMPNFKVVYAMSDPENSPGWDGETGFIHLAVDKHISQEGNKQAFLCGPPLMIDAASKVLKTKNLTDDRIFYDEF